MIYGSVIRRSFAFAIALFAMVLSFFANANAEPEYSRLGPLNAIVIENIRDAPFVIYLHGYGGTGEDAYNELLPEIQKSAVLRRVNWIFPDAPIGGWFAIEAVDGESMPDEEVWQATLKPTRAALRKMISSAKVEAKNVIWAGFSQGAITATDYVLHSNTQTGGLIVNSGIYFNSTDWKRNRSVLAGTKFFMSHDRNDDILPFSEAKKLEALLKDNGLVGHIETHSSGHSTPEGFTSKAVRSLLHSKALLKQTPLKSRRAMVCEKTLTPE